MMLSILHRWTSSTDSTVSTGYRRGHDGIVTSLPILSFPDWWRNLCFEITLTGIVLSFFGNQNSMKCCLKCPFSGKMNRRSMCHVDLNANPKKKFCQIQGLSASKNQLYVTYVDVIVSLAISLVSFLRSGCSE